MSDTSSAAWGAHFDSDDVNTVLFWIGLWLFSSARSNGADGIRGCGFFTALTPAASGLALLRSSPGSALARGALIFLPLLALAVLAVPKLRRVLSSSCGHSDALPAAGPFFLPCRTTHSRSFPKRHGFGYSYLQVAVPVGWAGSVGSVLAVDGDSTAGGADGLSRWRHWFTVEAGDYLFRGGQRMTLQEKLAAYLESEGRNISLEYDEAWLVTAPRFLGYAFNPVSFWYLYKAGTLNSMVLEVNNTFDERRMYFMDTEPAASGSEKQRAAWPKDFHVSPFCSRKGSYTLSATPPAFASGRGIDNTLTLLSSKAHAKLVARLYSSSKPIDARTLASVQPCLLFVARWFCIGFLTFPRIVAQAATLYFRRGLHVWYRPEVLPGSVGRTETPHEAAVERCWRRYLELLAESSGQAITYVSAGSALPREERFARHGSDPAPLKLEVLTPRFYSDLASAPSVTAYLAAESARPLEERSFVASDVEALLALVREGRGVTTGRGVPPRKWRWLAALRAPERKASQQPRPGKAPPEKKQHELDAFVREFLPVHQADEYRRAARRTVLTERLAFGMPALYETGWAVAVPLAFFALLAGIFAALGLDMQDPMVCVSNAYLVATWSLYIRLWGMHRGEARKESQEVEARAEKRGKEKIIDEDSSQ